MTHHRLTRTGRSAALLAAALATGLVLASCARDDTGGSPASTSPTAAGTSPTSARSSLPGSSGSSTAPAPSRTSASPAAGIVLSANGVGPYRVDVATRTSLAGAGQVTGVKEILPECQGFYSGRPTGRYAGKFVLLFKGELLVAIHSTDPTVHTPSGAHTGMTFAELERIYGDRGSTQDALYGLHVYVVPAGAFVVAFTEGPQKGRAAGMGAGEHDHVLAPYTVSDDSC